MCPKRCKTCRIGPKNRIQGLTFGIFENKRLLKKQSHITLMVPVCEMIFRSESGLNSLMAPSSRLVLLLQLLSWISVGLACFCERYPWGSWSACSRTCNHGVQHRQRWERTTAWAQVTQSRLEFRAGWNTRVINVELGFFFFFLFLLR